MADPSLLEALVRDADQTSALTKAIARSAQAVVRREASVLDPHDHEVLELEGFEREGDALVLGLLRDLQDAVGEDHIAVSG